MPDNRTVHIASIASEVPEYSAGQDVISGLIRKHFGDALTTRSLRLIRATFSHPSIVKRHFAVKNASSVIGESPDQKIARFTEESVRLAARAVAKALEKAGADPQDLRGIVVNTCTGYICPGISTYLIERLGLPRNIKAYDMVGSGCGGAIPNLEVAEAMIKAHGGIVVSVSVEICSAAFQMDNDLSLILSNALFGDGAAAAVLSTEPKGFELVASAGRYAPEERDTIRFVHKHGQLYNQLSVKLPDVVRKAAAEAIDEVLSSQNLKVSDIGHWALHTGGDKIINAVRDEIGIPEELLGATRKILAEYGNMSSPTVWFVLNELVAQGISEGDWCIMVAYGAGLSAHAYLLRRI